jgi:GT2 family glycosyltransferase
MPASAVGFGVVAIGRNEGERLKRCLHSALQATSHVVYVDSGSQDGSAAFARSVGVEVVELDMSIPFTAARARNAGFRRIKEQFPTLDFVQFVDGDCEFTSGWLEHAARYLRATPNAAVACGRLRERHPERSIYNRLCDAEWNTPVGRAQACGGIAMVRAHAFDQVHGFREDLIAGEEPELCLRLRREGWEIWRLEAEMAWHDAAMTRFSQWWRRSERAGHAFAEGAALHGKSPQRHWFASPAVPGSGERGFPPPHCWQPACLESGACCSCSPIRSSFCAWSNAPPTRLRCGFRGRSSCCWANFPKCLGSSATGRIASRGGAAC